MNERYFIMIALFVISANTSSTSMSHSPYSADIAIIVEFPQFDFLVPKVNRETSGMLAFVKRLVEEWLKDDDQLEGVQIGIIVVSPLPSDAVNISILVPWTDGRNEDAIKGKVDDELGKWKLEVKPEINFKPQQVENVEKRANEMPGGRIGVPKILFWITLCVWETVDLLPLCYKDHALMALNRIHMLIILRDYSQQSINQQIGFSYTNRKFESSADNTAAYISRLRSDLVNHLLSKCSPQIQPTQCYFALADNKQCVVEKKFTGPNDVAKWDSILKPWDYSKYCRKGPFKYSCPKEKCDEECEKWPKSDIIIDNECNVGCGQTGTEIVRPDTTNKLYENCRISRPCHQPSCSPGETPRPPRTTTITTTSEEPDSTEQVTTTILTPPSTTIIDTSLQWWVIALIIGAVIALIVIIIAITMCCRKKERKHRVVNPQMLNHRSIAPQHRQSPKQQHRNRHQRHRAKPSPSQNRTTGRH